jgi:hypothetical protein
MFDPKGAGVVRRYLSATSSCQKKLFCSSSTTNLTKTLHLQRSSGMNLYMHVILTGKLSVILPQSIVYRPSVCSRSFMISSRRASVRISVSSLYSKRQYSHQIAIRPVEWLNLMCLPTMRCSKGSHE